MPLKRPGTSLQKSVSQSLYAWKHASWSPVSSTANSRRVIVGYKTSACTPSGSISARRAFGSHAPRGTSSSRPLKPSSSLGRPALAAPRIEISRIPSHM